MYIKIHISPEKQSMRSNNFGEIISQHSDIPRFHVTAQVRNYIPDILVQNGWPGRKHVPILRAREDFWHRMAIPRRTVELKRKIKSNYFHEKINLIQSHEGDFARVI